MFSNIAVLGNLMPTSHNIVISEEIISIEKMSTPD